MRNIQKKPQIKYNEESDTHELERLLLFKVERFLSEMGGMFAFVGSQFQTASNGIRNFIDLLFYHRILQCLIVIELKNGGHLLKHMENIKLCLAVLDKSVRAPHENYSIGIILSKINNRTTIEYALRESDEPVGSEYRLFRTLPDEMKSVLPSPEQIEDLLDGI